MGEMGGGGGRSGGAQPRGILTAECTLFTFDGTGSPELITGFVLDTEDGSEFASLLSDVITVAVAGVYLVRLTSDKVTPDDVTSYLSHAPDGVTWADLGITSRAVGQTRDAMAPFRAYAAGAKFRARGTAVAPGDTIEHVRLEVILMGPLGT